MAKGNGYGCNNSTEMLDTKNPKIVRAKDFMRPFGWSSVSAIAPPSTPNANVPPNVA